MTLKQINERYIESCDEFCENFAKKQGIVFEGWVNNEVGEIATFSDHYLFNLSDIILDLMTDQATGQILTWHEESSHAAYIGEWHINYRSYVKGLKY